jgi:hypothetical protein
MSGSTSWGLAMSDIYHIRVSGHLDDRWSEWLGGMAIEREDDGATLLVGPVVDQAALHGVITRIRDLGLPLLSVKQVGDVHSTTKEASSNVQGQHQLKGSIE